MITNMESKGEIIEALKTHPMACKHINVKNAARDILMVMEWVRDNEEMGRVQEHFLHGFSYGTLWATEIMKLEPNLVCYLFVKVLKQTP